jgi:hypothetical protein
MSAGLIKIPHQHLILTGVGVIPTIPSPVTLEPGDTGWVWTTDIMRGQVAYNATDDIWYYRTVSDTIKVLISSTLISYITSSYAITSNERSAKEPIIAGINVIALKVQGVVTPYGDANWWFSGMPLQYDSSGGIVTPDISNITSNGFTLTAYDSGFLHYTTKH